MRIIVDERLFDRAFIEARCENFDEFKESLKDFGLDFVEQVTRVPKDKIIEAARMFATNSPATIIYAMGITQHSHGTDNVLATANLAMLTGNLGKPSTGSIHSGVRTMCKVLAIWVPCLMSILAIRQ